MKDHLIYFEDIKSRIRRSPAGTKFKHLKLGRNSTGDITFEWEPIETICYFNSIDPAVFHDGNEENIFWLLNYLYSEHRERWGAKDPVMERLIEERNSNNK